jgi:hypothetical protein
MWVYRDLASDDPFSRTSQNSFPDVEIREINDARMGQK